VGQATTMEITLASLKPSIRGRGRCARDLDVGPRFVVQI
jgi:hypothetical protein